MRCNASARARRLAAVVPLPAVAALILVAARAPAQPADSAGARPDSVVAPAGDPRDVPGRIRLVDSTAATPVVPVLDSTVVLPALVRNLPGGGPIDSIPPADTLGIVIRADTERKRGELTIAQLLSGRRPVWVEAMPGYAPTLGSPLLVDAGTPVAPDRAPMAADRATDRTTLADFTFLGPTGYVLGVPALATAGRLPESEGLESFDIVAIDSSLAPGPFRSAGSLLARPRAVHFSAFAMPDPPAPYRVRSALLYRRGAGNLLDTAARFSSPLFAHGIAGSFVRHEAEAVEPLLGSLSTRYALAVGITRGGPLRSWVEGRLFTMRVEADYPGGYGGDNNPPPTRARAEWSAREARLHAFWTGSGLVASASLRAGEANATQVGYDLGRERWSYPEVQAEARLTGGGPRSWSWSLEGWGSRRRVELRSDVVDVRPVFRSARAGAGLRRASETGGVAADVAADLREGDPALVNARVSLWRAGGRGRFRIDAESAHERPSYVDLMTPFQVDTMTVFSAAPSTLVLARGGDPTLSARALRGVLGAASWRAGPNVELLAFGSARRVSDDFGWDAARRVTPDTVYVTDAARPRGDGWVFHAAAGWNAAAGPFAARGLAWVRGGDDGLSPRAGSPPRVGLDAAIGVRASFFEGDLPLELDVLAQAWGPRRGPASAPAVASWGARLHADFGSAGLFATVTNVFDADLPSGVFWTDRGTWASLPARSLSAGVVWYILD